MKSFKEFIKEEEGGGSASATQANTAGDGSKTATSYPTPLKKNKKRKDGSVLSRGIPDKKSG